MVRRALCAKVTLVLLGVAAVTAVLLLVHLPSRTPDVEKIREALAAYDQGKGGPMWYEMDEFERSIRWVSEDRVKVFVMADIGGRPFHRNYTLSRQGDHWVVTDFSHLHGDLGPRG